jgi:hypothetical protein
MKTKKKKILKNANKKTLKNNTKKKFLKILTIGYPLYASKKYEGSTILEYNKTEELKYKDKCLMTNSSWFGDLDVAKSYKTKNTHIYRWKAAKQINLLNINISNNDFINRLFTTSGLILKPSINISNKKISKIKYEIPYLKMTQNEKALYEFKFCFGFISVKEQYEFMKFIKYLINNKIINIETRDGQSILHKLNIKIKYYELALLFKKKEFSNRLSFYDIDKHAIMNLCKIVKEKKLNISGVYQKNDTSFWFPDFIVYKMNIKEYILFNPQDNLTFDTLID